MNDTVYCRLTGEPLKEIINFGDLYVSDFVPPGQELDGDRAPLRLGVGPSTGLVQLFESYSPEKMYRRYWYRSSLNESMRKDLSKLVDSCVSFPGFKLEKGDVVVDIASNDGIMLTHQAFDDCFRIGIDPSDVARDGFYANVRPQPNKASWLVNDFFSAQVYRNVAGEQQAKLVTIVAMFYDIEEPVNFLKEVKSILHPQGLLCIQLSYTPLMIDQNAFDNVCHEHLMYYNLSNLQEALSRAGLEVVDADLNSTNAGSLRVYVVHKENPRSLVPTHVKYLEYFRMRSILEQEAKYENYNWDRWIERLNRAKTELVEFLKAARDRGEKVYGYGASTKGNTILQAWGITPELLPAIADRSEAKWGLVCAGTGIPVISEEQMRAEKPDWLVVLPYTFISMFLERERELIEGGTKFIAPLPQFKVFDKKDLEVVV